MPTFKKLPKKYQPPGFHILHEDVDLIVGIKEAGYLTVSALWNKEKTIHSALNEYVRKGNSKSRKCVFVVHRLDQGTSGILIFAKTEEAQGFLKNNWKSTTKSYYAVIHGQLPEKTGKISSYLEEDEDYVIHSNDEGKGKLAETEYQVLKETPHFSLLKINLLTGRKNQIRVHLADKGHAIVGDTKYGKKETKKHHHLALHAAAIEFTHPHNQKRMRFACPPPPYFSQLVNYKYEGKD